MRLRLSVRRHDPSGLALPRCLDPSEPGSIHGLPSSFGVDSLAWGQKLWVIERFTGFGLPTTFAKCEAQVDVGQPGEAAPEHHISGRGVVCAGQVTA